jgi:DNA-binding XRE family transcriptional regulator
MKMPRTNRVDVIVSDERFSVPPDRARAVVALLKDYRVDGRSESIPSEQVFERLNAKRGGKSASVLRGYRYRAGLTQAQLAEKLDITQGDLSKMENGTRPIGKRMAQRLAAFFKTDYRVFL